MLGYIYITTNLINNMRYIGQHHASKFSTKYKGSGTRLKEAFNIFGKENFKVELLEAVYTTDEDLDAAEIKWIAHFDAVNSPDFYNRAYGGNGNPGHPLSDSEKRQRGIQSKLNWQNPEYRAKLNAAIERNKLLGVYKTMTGKQHSEETKRKMSISRSGERNGNYGRKFTEEHKQKLSIAKKTKPTYTMTSEGNPMRNRIWMSKGSETLPVKPEDVNYYLNQGYIKGRQKRAWINNGKSSKSVLLTDLDFYLSTGWVKGRI